MQRFRFVSFAAGTGLALLLAIEAAHAREPVRIDVTLKGHRFSSSTCTSQSDRAQGVVIAE